MKHVRRRYEEEAIPVDLIYAIFLLLRVRTVLRLRCLSKFWNKIITSREFAIAHMLKHSTDPAPCILYTDPFSSAINGHSQLVYSIHPSLWADAIGDSRGRRLPPPIKLDLPFQVDPGNGVSWIYSSSCHGMLCMANYDCRTGTASIYIWNPFTRQSKQLPWPVVEGFVGFGYDHGLHVAERDIVLSSFVGFGYDHVTQDYKVVVSSPHTGRAQIMSLKTNVWRSTRAAIWGVILSEAVAVGNGGDVYWIPRNLTEKGSGILISQKKILPWNKSRPLGASFCFGNYTEFPLDASVCFDNNREFVSAYATYFHTTSILKFNFADESLSAYHLPPQNNGSWNMELGQCNKSLSLCFYDEFHTSIHVWTMTLADGSSATWNRLYSLSPVPLRYSCLGIYPVGVTREADLIMACRKRIGLVAYCHQKDRRCKSFLDLLMDEPARPLFSNGSTHLLEMETLISPL